eukprot:SAG31_NODE_169_length_21415_cov_29.765338_6_plen_221_part_00
MLLIWIASLQLAKANTLTQATRRSANSAQLYPSSLPVPPGRLALSSKPVGLCVLTTVRIPPPPAARLRQTPSSIRTQILVAGGGWQFRLCPLGSGASSELTEACFQKTPVPFAANSRMMMSNGTMLNLSSTFVSEGTLPAGSTWQMLPIPMTRGGPDLREIGYQFEPPCYEPIAPGILNQGTCAGEWISEWPSIGQTVLRAPTVDGAFLYKCCRESLTSS